MVTAKHTNELMWDSGKVSSNRSMNVPYGGGGSKSKSGNSLGRPVPVSTAAPAAPLQADTVYTWNVTYWIEPPPSTPTLAQISTTITLHLPSPQPPPSAVATSTFSTGLYTIADWKGAAWIGGAMGQYVVCADVSPSLTP
jgi:hypothetical protein